MLKKFRARKQLRNYTCGPASLRSIFYFYGVSVSEQELVEAGEIKEDGTDVPIMRYLARQYGFSFWSKDNATITEMRRWLERKIPVLILYQDWGPPNGKNGHYAVITGINKDYVEIADPSNYQYADGNKFANTKRMSREVFLRRWFEVEKGIHYRKWFAIIKPSKTNGKAKKGK